MIAELEALAAAMNYPTDRGSTELIDRALVDEIDAALEQLSSDIDALMAARVARQYGTSDAPLPKLDAGQLVDLSDLALTFSEALSREQLRQLVGCLLAPGVVDFPQEQDSIRLYAVALRQCLMIMCREDMVSLPWSFGEGRVVEPQEATPSSGTLAQIWLGRGQALEGAQIRQERIEFWTRALRVIETLREPGDQRYAALRVVIASRVVAPFARNSGLRQEHPHGAKQALLVLRHALPALCTSAEPDALRAQAFEEAGEAMPAAYSVSVSLDMSPSFQEFFRNRSQDALATSVAP